MARLTALVLLLLAAAARYHAARAQDAPSQSDSGSSYDDYDPADANQDGTVTRREGRRYRRKVRRANRKPGSHDEEDDAAEAASGETPSLSASASGAMARAAGAASALTTSLPNAAAGDLPSGAGKASGAMGTASGTGAGAGAGGAGLSAAASAGAAVAAGSQGGAAQPPEAALLAQRGGYSGAFAAAGLKLAADGRTVVRLDGKPPTAEDWARLRTTLASMPRALERRPDFFDVISPGHFSDLKRGYHEHPELAGTVYKHVGTTADERDLAHTASCAKVSGECNAFVEKASYKKGELVAPEDLKKLWDELEKETAGEGGGPREEIEAASPLSLRNGDAAGGAPEEQAAGSAAPERAARGAGPTAEGEKSSTARGPAPVFAAAARWFSSIIPFASARAAAGGRAVNPFLLGGLGLAAAFALWLLAGRKGD